MRRAKVSDYVETIAVGPYDAISKQGKLLTNYPPMSDGRPCFAFRNGRNASLELGTAAAVGLLVATVVAANNSMPAQPDMPLTEAFPTSWKNDVYYMLLDIFELKKKSCRLATFHDFHASNE